MQQQLKQQQKEDERLKFEREDLAVTNQQLQSQLINNEQTNKLTLMDVQLKTQLSDMRLSYAELLKEILLL